jgi:hypothetical protein
MADYEDAKQKYGHDAEALVLTLSSQTDGWNTVKDSKKKDADAEKSKALKSRDAAATAAGSQVRPEGISQRILLVVVEEALGPSQQQQQKVTASLDSLNLLLFPDRITGRRVSLALFSGGKLLSPAQLRAQIMHPLEIITAEARFFAQRSPRWKHRRQEAPMPIHHQLQQQSLALQQQQVVCVSLMSLLLISSTPSQHNQLKFKPALCFTF